MSKISFDKQVSKTIEILKKVFDELDISAYLIGAQARDVWFLPKRSPRITQDIDWVIAHSDENLFKELKKTLVEREGFSTTNNPLKLKDTDGNEVDLILFDYVETPHFLGLHEIFERGTEGVKFENNKTYLIATLPSIILLKLIAWDNNPDYRGKDVEDIAYIFDNFDIYTDDSYELFTEVDPQYISARTIGRKINYIIAESLDLKNQIIRIIENQIKNPDKSRFIRIILGKSDKTEQFVDTQLKELLTGINEKNSS